MYEDIKERNKNLKMYSASVSHEMLNPIKCIIALTNQLLEQVREKERREFLSMIFCSAKLLQCHTQDLLDMNMLQKGHFHLQLSQMENLHTCVMEIVRLMRLQAQMKQVSIRVVFKNIEKDKVFYFDKSRLQQVLLNLISNGVKFSQKNSKLSIFAELDKVDSVKWLVKISVLDQGIGINK